MELMQVNRSSIVSRSSELHNRGRQTDRDKQKKTERGRTRDRQRETEREGERERERRGTWVRSVGSESV